MNKFSLVLFKFAAPSQNVKMFSGIVAFHIKMFVLPAMDLVSTSYKEGFKSASGCKYNGAIILLKTELVGKNFQNHHDKVEIFCF